MKINADFRRRVALQTDILPWHRSPATGVERRYLDRDGDEVARATSIVRYAAGSRFERHVHDLGEEFLVLDGVFSDESGDFPPGSYVRNPPGSSHRPFSVPGCTILVKLRQMDPLDRASVRVHWRDANDWVESGIGERKRRLFASTNEIVEVVSWGPGTRLAPIEFPGGAEYFVLEGEFADAEGIYSKHGWLRLPPGAVQTVISGPGAVVFRKRGRR